ncbi:MAG: hypothetical protein ACK44F_03350 [Roseococcus sp.]
MSMPIARERKILSEAEFALVAPSHYPEVARLDREALIALARRLREARDAARTRLAAQRRAKRGKAEPRGSLDDTGVAAKKQVFAAALRRVNKRLEG